MLLTVLLAATAVPTAVDAERAFARDAQRIGQWSAFRRYARHDAVMFTPQVVWAHEFLRGRKNPPQSVRWQPAESYVSCDGRIAVNRGPWQRDGGKRIGYFTTVWQFDRNRWRWAYDNGDELQSPWPWPKEPFVRRAACDGKATRAPLLQPDAALVQRGKGPPQDYGHGASADRTLQWDWKVEANGDHRFRAYLWNGERFEQVVYNAIKAK